MRNWMIVVGILVMALGGAVALIFGGVDEAVENRAGAALLFDGGNEEVALAVTPQGATKVPSSPKRLDIPLAKKETSSEFKRMLEDVRKGEIRPEEWARPLSQDELEAIANQLIQEYSHD